MVRQGRVVWSRIDYILGSKRRIFQNVDVRYPRHNSDHIMVLGCLYGASLREHYCYLGRRMRLPLRPPIHQKRTRADKIFAEFWRAIPKQDKRSSCHNSRILAEMSRLVNKRVSTRREPG